MGCRSGSGSGSGSVSVSVSGVGVGGDAGGCECRRIRGSPGLRLRVLVDWAGWNDLGRVCAEETENMLVVVVVGRSVPVLINNSSWSPVLMVFVHTRA